MRTFLQTIQGFSALGILTEDDATGWVYEHLFDRGHGPLQEAEQAVVLQMISGFGDIRGFIASNTDWTEVVWMDPENIFYLFRLSEKRVAIIHFRTEQVPRFGVGLLAHLKRNLASLLN